MVTKSLLRIIFVGGGNAINAGLGFLFLTAAARTLSLEDFGKYALLMSLLLALAKLLDFGTNSIFVTRFITERKDNLNNTFITLRIILFFAAIPIFIILAYFFHVLNLTILLIFVLGLIGYFFNFTFHAYFQKDENFLGLILINTLPALVKGVLALLILFGVFNPSLILIWAIFSLSILTTLFITPFLPKDIRKFEIDYDGVSELFKKATPAGISLMVAEGWPALNNAAAKITKGFSDVGIFSLANKISSTFTIVSFSIFTVLLPKNAALKKQRKGYDYKETLILSIGIIFLSFIAAVLAKFLVPVIFGVKFSDSIGLLNILIFASAFTAIHTFIENFFFIEKKTKTIFYINIAKLVIFGISTLLLIGPFKLYGLAVANLISAISAVIMTLLITIKGKVNPTRYNY